MLSDEEYQKIAKRLILEQNDNYEYSLVYEDEELEDMSEEEWKKIYDLMYEANITVSFEEEK